MIRRDLLALTPAALVALANRGLVKRAVKELDAGTVPALEVTDDGTLCGRFADGSEVQLPAGEGFGGARCSCGAVGTCRHRVGLVLAYQRRNQGEAGESLVSSPGATTDEELTAAFGRRALTAAQRVHAAGYSARIRRPSAGDPVAEVELPACTVRFLVPGDLGYVHTDAAVAKREETIVLAVWAFRAADERVPDVPEARLDVGGTRVRVGTGLESALVVADRLLLEGAADASPVLVAKLHRLRGELEAAGLRWPAAAVAELAEQLGFHRSRSAHYRARRFAELLSELHARHRAATAGASPRSRVLGTGEPSETPLRRVRLTSLGCRITGVPGERLAELYFADASTVSVLVLRRSWTIGPGEKCTGHDLAAQRIGGTSLRCLAEANVVSESAHRSASRVLRLSSARVGQTTTTPIGDAWSSLPAPLVVRDYATFATELGALPPRLIRPRVAAELVRVFHVAQVHHLNYHPGDQRLTAHLTDEAGHPALLSAHYSEHRPGALDALATALTHTPHLISGTAHRTHTPPPPNATAPRPHARTPPHDTAHGAHTHTPPNDTAPRTHAHTPPSATAHDAHTHTRPNDTAPRTHARTPPSATAHGAHTHTRPNDTAPDAHIPSPASATTHRVRTPPPPNGTAHGVHTSPSVSGTAHGVHTSPSVSGTAHGVHTSPSVSGTAHGICTPPLISGAAHRTHTPPPINGPVHGVHTPPPTSGTAPRTPRSLPSADPHLTNNTAPRPTDAAPCAGGHHLASPAVPRAGGPSLAANAGHRDVGTLVIDPISVQTACGHVHPDLAPDTSDGPLRLAPEPAPDPLGDALDLLAGAAHLGLLRTARRPAGKYARVAAALADAGYPTAAATLTAFRDALPTADPALLTRTWRTAHLRLLLTTTHR